jgi:peptidyl-prolyl cis-trans isomerase D
MLHFMRKHAKYFYVFFFLIIISFIFFYVGPVDDSGPRSLAEIGKERISITEFWRAYDNTRESYREIYKEKFDAEMEQKLNLKETVLMQLVSSKILYVAARDMGLKVTDDELREAITSEPAFQREGKFRQDVYQRTLQLNRITTTYYEDKLREDLLVRKITRLIEASIEISDEDVLQIQGNEDFARQIREAMLREKKAKAVDAFIQGLRDKYKVIMRAELIA